MKLGLLAASLVLVAGGAVSCGDDGGGSAAKDDAAASTEDFCGAFEAFEEDLRGVTGEEENLGELLKKAAKRIEDVGTPKGIPDDAKAGLQLTLDAIADLADDASAEDMANLEGDFSDADKAKTDAFTSYLEETCPDLGDGGDSSSDPSSDSSEGS
jgi:hypothetical protein